MTKHSPISEYTAGFEDPRSPKNANRSVGIGLFILKAMADMGRPGTLGEIAQAARMPASRTHRFLAGMIQAGAVRQDPSSSRYDFGPLLVTLGVAALGRVDTVKMGTEALTKLTAETGLVSVLVVWASDGPMVIRWEQGELGTAVRIREGRKLPLLRTASGKVFVSYLPEEKTMSLVELELAAPLHQASGSKTLTIEDVDTLRACVRRDGVADNTGESELGIVGVAAPVFGSDGEIIMAISLIGVAGVVDLGTDSQYAKKLKAAADDVSGSFGASPSAAIAS